MTIPPETEKALRAALKPVERPPMPRLITSRVLFHPDDWRAFVKGLETTFSSEVRLREPAGDWLPIEALWQGMDWYKDLNLYVLNPPFEVQKTPGKEYLPKDLAPLEAEVYFGRAPLRPLRFNGGWADWLNDTVIHGLHHKSDDGKRRFLQSVKRVIGKISTNRVQLVDPKTGKVELDDWKGAPVRFGFAALRWRGEAKNRFLQHDGAPKPDWQFPEDHPWYQPAG